MKRLCIVVLTMLAFKAYGQKKVLLDLSAGLTAHVIKDDAMSPVRYNGVLPTLSFAIIKEKKGKRLTELRFPIQYSNIHAKNAQTYPSMKGPLFRFDIDYIYLRHTHIIKDTTKGTLFLGASFHTLLSFRYMKQLDNSAIIYDYFNSLGLSTAYRRSFRFRNKVLTHYHRISIPLLSFGTRPDYLNLYNVIAPKGNDPIADAFSRARIVSLNSLQRLIIRNSLWFPIRSNNLIGLTYEWQYYGASFEVPIKSASHSFMFSLLVNI
jgi:hypothetical protein